MMGIGEWMAQERDEINTAVTIVEVRRPFIHKLVIHNSNSVFKMSVKLVHDSLFSPVQSNCLIQPGFLRIVAEESHSSFVSRLTPARALGGRWGRDKQQVDWWSGVQRRHSRPFPSSNLPFLAFWRNIASPHTSHGRCEWGIVLSGAPLCPLLWPSFPPFFAEYFFDWE